MPGFGEGQGYDPERTGVIIGSGIGGLSTFEVQHDVYRERGASKISPFFIPMFIADIAAGIVSMQFQAKGPNYATVSACATSAHAIGDAFRTIQYGDADVMITGGAEATVTPMAIGGFANMRALSERNDEFATRVAPVRRHARRLRDGRGRGDGRSSRSWSTRRSAAPASTARSSATAPPATPTTSRRPRRAARARSARCAAR